MKALDYLSERPFKVIYVHYNKLSSVMLENILYEEEYPAYIPPKDERVILDDKTFFVLDKLFNILRNVSVIMLLTEDEFVNKQ